MFNVSYLRWKKHRSTLPGAKNVEVYHVNQDAMLDLSAVPVVADAALGTLALPSTSIPVFSTTPPGEVWRVHEAAYIPRAQEAALLQTHTSVVGTTPMPNHPCHVEFDDEPEPVLSGSTLAGAGAGAGDGAPASALVFEQQEEKEEKEEEEEEPVNPLQYSLFSGFQGEVHATLSSDGRSVHHVLSQHPNTDKTASAFIAASWTPDTHLQEGEGIGGATVLGLPVPGTALRPSDF